MTATKVKVGDIDPDKIPARLTIPEVCRDYLRISTSTAYRQILAGNFPVEVQGGNGCQRWVRGADLVAALGLARTA